MNKTPKFNIIRKQRGQVVITHRELIKSEALPILKNLKARARDAHSNVFFDMIEVPYELTAEGKEQARILNELREQELYDSAKRTACLNAGHEVNQAGYCHECWCYPRGAVEQAA